MQKGYPESHSLRLASADDLVEFVQIRNAVWSGHRVSESELRRDLEQLPPENIPTRWLLRSDDGTLGFAECCRDVGSYHPKKWTIAIGVYAEARGIGIGGRLYQTVLEFLSPYMPEKIYTQVAEPDTAALEFALRRGFSEVKRDFESDLDLTTLDRSALRAMVKENVQVRSAKELDNEPFRRAWHALFETVRVDTPRTDPPTPLSFDTFNCLVLEDPEFLWEGSQIAFDGNEMIGFSGLYASDRAGEIIQWLTGVRREYRGRGVARSMKAHAALWAIENGYQLIKTDNDTRNAPMLTINDRMGFKRKLGIITMLKTLDPSAPEQICPERMGSA